MGPSANGIHLKATALMALMPSPPHTHMAAEAPWRYPNSDHGQIPSFSESCADKIMRKEAMIGIITFQL